MSEHETKEALKQALKEWLDEKLSAFGWWSLRTIVVLGLGALVLFILKINGWQKLG